MSGWAFGVIRSVLIFTLSVVVRYLWNGKLKHCSVSKLQSIMKAVSKGPIMHRGGIPENTIEAIHDSKNEGASAVEVDLQFTKDSHPVLLHDDTVNRTSNGTGNIHSLNFSEVKCLDFGTKERPGCRIPTLIDLMGTIKELDMVLFLELKAANSKELVKIVEFFKRDSSLYQKVVVISFYPYLLHQLRMCDPEIMVGLSIYGPMLHEGSEKDEPKGLRLSERFFVWSLTSWVPRWLGAKLLIMYKQDVLLNRVKFTQLREDGYEIVLYTVNSKEEKNYLNEVLHVPFMTDVIT